MIQSFFTAILTVFFISVAAQADKYQHPLPYFEGQTAHTNQSCFVDFGNIYRNINGVWVIQVYGFGVGTTTYEIELRTHLFSLNRNLFRGKGVADETSHTATEFELEVKLSPTTEVLAVAGSTQAVTYDESGQSTPTEERKLFICLPKK